MSNVDISPEAVEWLAREMDERVESFDAMIAVQLESVRELRRTRGTETRQQHESIAATLRAQAVRIAELEAEVRDVLKECLVAHGQAEDALKEAATARNDALREAAQAVRVPSGRNDIYNKSRVDAANIITALIKEPTP